MTKSAKVISPNDFACAIGLRKENETCISTPGLADLCRTVVWRWGLCRRAALTTCVQNRLRSITADDTTTGNLLKKTVEDLCQVGDIAEVLSSGQPRLARVQPNWIRLNDSIGACVGTIPSSTLGNQFVDELSAGVVRRFRLESTELLATFREYSIAECQLDTWLGTPGYTASILRVSGSALGNLADLWPHLISRLDREGLPLGSTENISIVTGSPGSFFGRPGSEQLSTGRWATPSKAGVWVGKRRGYSDRDFRPLVLRIDANGQARSIDLFDENEFCWALIARGLLEGSPEHIKLAHDNDTVVVHPTCPLPAQITKLLQLFGHRDEGWKWHVSEEIAQDLIPWLEQFGLRIINFDKPTL